MGNPALSAVSWFCSCLESNEAQSVQKQHYVLLFAVTQAKISPGSEYNIGTSVYAMVNHPETRHSQSTNFRSNLNKP